MHRNRQNKVARREVLKAAVIGAIGAPWIVPGRALGRDNAPPPSERVALGHIGVGGQGRYLFGRFQAVAESQSVAVADCYQDRRESMAAVCKGKAYADFRDLLARDDIDAVVVATPDHWHVPIAILAAKAGKSTYVEKPLGLSVGHLLACQKAFAEAGVVFQYGTQQRSSANCFLGCEMVRRGAIGKIVALEVDAPNGGAGGSTAEAPVPAGFDYAMWLGPAPARPYTVDRCKPPGTYWVYDQSIGYLGGWGAHPLDILVWGCDADLSGPVVVEGTGVVPTEGLYDTVYNWDMKLMLGEVPCTFRPGSDRTKFIGTDGWIQVCRDPGQTIASDPALLPAQLAPGETKLLRSTNHYANFVEAVKAADPSKAVSNLKDAIRSDLISHLCDIAVRTGEKIAWDPAAQKLAEGSDKARGMLARALRAPWTL